MAENIVIAGTKEEEHEEKTLDRAVGTLEAEIEHHEEKLDDHKERIESGESDREWLQSQIDMLRNEITAAANLPAAPSEELLARIGAMEEKLEKMTSASVQSLTEPAEPEIKQEVKATRSILDRLL